MNVKKVVLALSLAVLMACGIVASFGMGISESTYNGERTDPAALYQDPHSYDNDHADGAAAVIVNENLEKTAAENVVFSVVFNFRGYDTLGESFILIASIAGSMVILRRSGRKGKGDAA